jgi:hypothetical protein
MSKKTKTKAENPEVEQQKAETTQPAYVQELLEKGVVVIQGRSRGELDEKLAAIPSDVNFYTGAVGQYMGTGLYRIQVNLKED